MTTLREDLVPVVDEMRTLVGDLGLRRFTVVTRKRTWSGSEVGRGTVTDVDTTLAPIPRVRPPSPHLIATSGGKVEEGDRIVDRISATYSEDALTGGSLTNSQDVLWLIDGDAYHLVGKPEKQTFGWRVQLRRRAY
jgi:hypothetical protein